jgi:predicted ATPase/DNA-binding CsgD family transcriptional regulator
VPPTVAKHPNNLPAQFSTFIGREREVLEVLKLVRQDGIRLVTLTGPGGVGKTRLAMQAASHHLADTFQDGVFFVSLAPITEPTLVTSAIADALDVHEVSGTPLLSTLQAHLRDRAPLLLLDNFEHLVTAAPVVADLLTASTHLKVLVTSRAPLRLRGEYEFAVPPLRLAATDAPPGSEQLLAAEAVRLFEARAQAVATDFAVTRQNLEVVLDICRRLDALPLAIELAAARIKVLPPEALLAHLQRRLSILTGGARDAPVRHHTLRGTIAWSYDLLDQFQQQLFRRLTVFVGDCTLSAVAAVCLDGGDAQEGVVDSVAALVDQSLLQRVESATNEPRFRMLETIREYGLDQLPASGEAEALGHRHAEYFRALAIDAESGLRGAAWESWRRQLDMERENLRAALNWALAWGQADIALGLVGPLWRWFRPNAITEGRRWVQQALVLQGSTVPARALALHALGVLAMQQGEYRVAASAWKESISIWRAIGDRPRLTDALTWIGSIYRPGARAVPALLGEAVSLAREVGDPRRLALALGNFGWQLLQLDQLPAAKSMLAEALPLARVPGDPWELIWVLYASGLLAIREGDTALAQERFSETLELAREARDSMMASLALAASGRAALREGNTVAAVALFREGLGLSHDAGFAIGLAHHLEGIALVCGDLDQLEEAARLLGAAEAAYPLVDVPGLVPYSSLVEHAVTSLRKNLGQLRFAALLADGRVFDRDEAVAEARIAADAANSIPPPLTTAPDSLTRREIEVLRLLAAGHSNPEIATGLVLSVKTVERHLANVYAKIGARSRVEAATYAVTHDLR